MQKLLTVYLDNGAYGQGKMLVTTYSDRHGLIEEHIAPYLADGWRVVSVSSFGGSNEGLHVRGWLVVLIEKEG